MWTLQEYCSSAQLIVVEEPVEKREGQANEKVPVRRTEALLVWRLRREHMARQQWCVPVWLNTDVLAMMRGLPAEDSKQIWETYKALRQQLHCLCPEDTIRAL